MNIYDCLQFALYGCAPPYTMERLFKKDCTEAVLFSSSQVYMFEEKYPEGTLADTSRAVITYPSYSSLFKSQLFGPSAQIKTHEHCCHSLGMKAGCSCIPQSRVSSQACQI